MQASAANPAQNARVFWLAALIFLVVLWAFFPAVHSGFVSYDDPEYVTANHYVQSGFSAASVKWAFARHGANWHPLTWLSHTLDGQLFGLNPYGHHLHSVILHAMNAALAFLFLYRATGKIGRSFIAGLLFGLHPLRVESVAWISERKDVLSVFFALLALMAYVRYVRAPGSDGVWWYCASLVLFAGGLLSKSMLVTLPALLWLLDFWPLQRKLNGLLLVEKIPFFLLSFGMSLIAFFAQKNGTAMVTELTLNARIQNALVAYCRYLGKLFWPENLCVIYPYPKVWPHIAVIAAILLLTVISVFATLWRNRHPFLLTGWFWFLGTLVPVIGIIQVGAQSLADRYSYLPCLGVLIVIIWGLAAITSNWRWRFIGLISVSLITTAFCFGLTRRQITYWRNSETLFQRAVAVTRNNTLALIGWGAALADHGETDKAIELYRRALQITPGYYEALDNLGLALAAQSRWEEAITQYQLALQARPSLAETLINLGVAFAHQGNLTQAQTAFESALKIDPANPIAYGNLGGILLQQQQFGAAAAHFQSALHGQPDNPAYAAGLGIALLSLGRLDDSISALRHSLQLGTTNAEVHNNLGSAYGRKGELEAAITEFQAALHIDPQFQKAADNLAIAQKLKQNLPAKPQ